MIRPGILIRGKITPTIDLKGKTNASIIREYPELENVEIKPTTEEQILKSEKYGFDEVKILGVTAEIDENIKSENIKEGTTILGVEGGYKGVDTSDATATVDDIASGKTAYVNGEKIEGTVETITGSKPMSAEKVFDFGGSVAVEAINEKPVLFKKNSKMLVAANYDKFVKAIKLTSDKIVEGNTVLGVSGSVKIPDTSDATALSEDILQDKTAYVNNEKITGTMQEYDGSYTGNTANNGFVVDEELWNSLLSTIDSTKGYKTTKLPEELTQIGPYAFYRLSWLKLPQLPKNIQSIGEYAFYGCNMYFALTELPESITSIGGYAFYNCHNTPLQNLPSQLTVIKESCFYSCNKMTISKLPEKLTSIEKYGFYNCTSITISELPEGLRSLQQSAFAKCNSITIKELPIEIKTIEPYCFQECSSIPSFKALGDVTSIGNYAFNKCSALQYIQFPNITSVPTLGTNVFTSTPIGSKTGYIYVPNTLVDSFKSATNWSAYASQIKPISELEG